MAKRNRDYHAKFRAEILKAKTDLERGAMYISKGGCKGSTSKTATNDCTHKDYGCGGKQKHKTSVSKHCLYSKQKGAKLKARKEEWSKARLKLLETESDVTFLFGSEIELCE